MKDWIENLQSALRSEWSYARKEHAQQRQQSQSEQLALGLIWPIMRLTETTPLYGQQTELWLRSTGPELHGGLQAGDPVRIAPSIHAEGIAATVANVDLQTATLVTKAADATLAQAKAIWLSARILMTALIGITCLGLRNAQRRLPMP